jgi:hypothetical protein
MATYLLPVIGAGLIYFVYVKGKKRSDSDAIQDQQDGLDTPDWATGQKTSAATTPNYDDGFKPSCQVWDETLQLFLNAGDVASDMNINNCFRKANDNPTNIYRYVDKDGKLFWKNDQDEWLNNISTEESGHCLFWEQGAYRPRFASQAVINRGERMCFGIGGQKFVRKDGVATYNPNISYDSSTVAQFDELSDSSLATDVTAKPANSAFCESAIASNNNVTIWGHTTASAAGDGSVQNCLKLTGTTRFPTFRWRDDLNNKFVYNNPNTNKLVQVQIN